MELCRNPTWKIVTRFWNLLKNEESLSSDRKQIKLWRLSLYFYNYALQTFYFLWEDKSKLIIFNESRWNVNLSICIMPEKEYYSTVSTHSPISLKGAEMALFRSGANQRSESYNCIEMPTHLKFCLNSFKSSQAAMMQMVQQIVCLNLIQR